MIDEYFNRLLKGEESVKRMFNNPSPTVPKYNLDPVAGGPNAIACSLGGGATSMVYYTLPAGTGLPIYTRFQVYIPQAVIDGFLAHYPSTGFPSFASSFFGSDEIRYENYWDNPTHVIYNYFRWTTQDTHNYLIGNWTDYPLVTTDTWNILDYNIQTDSTINVKLNGTLFSSHIPTWAPPIDPTWDNWYYGTEAWLPGSVPEIQSLALYIKNIIIGTSEGASDIFSGTLIEDFTSDTGGVSNVVGP